MPPSNVPVTSIASLRTVVPLEVGIGRDARFIRAKKLDGVAAAGPAVAVAAKAKMEAAIEAFMVMI